MQFSITLRCGKRLNSWKTIWARTRSWRICSDSARERFLRPLYAGVFLDRSLGVSSRLPDQCFMQMAAGRTVVPSRGMGAISAGALVSYACDEIVMTRGASIGASTPISPAGDLGPDVNESRAMFTPVFVRQRTKTEAPADAAGAAAAKDYDAVLSVELRDASAPGTVVMSLYIDRTHVLAATPPAYAPETDEERRDFARRHPQVNAAVRRLDERLVVDLGGLWECLGKRVDRRHGCGLRHLSALPPPV